MTTVSMVTYVCPICQNKELRSEGGFVPETLSAPRCKDCNSIMERYEYAIIKSIWKIFRKS